MDFRRKPTCGQGKQWNRQERECRQLPIEHEQESHDPDKRQRRRQHPFDPVNEDPLDMLRVVCHPGHDLPCRSILKIGDGQALKGGEDMPAKIVDHSLLKLII